MEDSKKVTLKNLTNWALTFKRINSLGDVIIPPNGKVTMSAEEVMSQIYNNNRLFVGEDGRGAHARIFIEDEQIRIDAEFEGEQPQKTQDILTDEKLKEIFSGKSLAAFKKKVEKDIDSQAEKAKVMEYAQTHKINDHDKIEFLEKYTGFRLENPQ